MKIKVVIFDADNTLWNSGIGDYVSQVESEFKLKNRDLVERVKDKAEFRLNKGVRKFIIKFNQAGGQIGMMSDNHLKDVKKVSQLFKIWQYFDLSLVKIRLYKGYCPKAKIIKKMVEKQGYDVGDVAWLDDKNYSKAASNHGISFIQIKDNQIREVLMKIVQ